MKASMKSTFEYRTTKNGIKVVTKDIVDYSTILRLLDPRKISYYTFHPKSLKAVKAVIRQLPGDTPAEDVSNEIVALGYSVITVWQMFANRPQPQGGHQTFNIQLFLVTLTRSERAE
jgi:hypothetical protein